METNTVPFDAARYLDDASAQAELLEDALRSGEESYIGEALAVIARARGLTTQERASRSSRDDRPGQAESDPRLATLLKVARDLGVRLHLVPEVAE